MDNELKLLPCPFCNGQAFTSRVGDDGSFVARCGHCDTWIFADTERGAADKWNHRPAEDALRAQLQAARADADRLAAALTTYPADMNWEYYLPSGILRVIVPYARNEALQQHEAMVKGGARNER